MLGLWYIFFHDLHSLALTFFATSLIHLSLFAIILKSAINHEG